MTNPIVAPQDFREHIDKTPTILIVVVNRFPPVAPRGDVVEGAGKLNAERPYHTV